MCWCWQHNKHTHTHTLRLRLAGFCRPSGSCSRALHWMWGGGGESPGATPGRERAAQSGVRNGTRAISYDEGGGAPQQGRAGTTCPVAPWQELGQHQPSGRPLRAPHTLHCFEIDVLKTPRPVVHAPFVDSPLRAHLIVSLKKCVLQTLPYGSSGTRSDEALGVSVSVARIAPSLIDLGRTATYYDCIPSVFDLPAVPHVPLVCCLTLDAWRCWYVQPESQSIQSRYVVAHKTPTDVRGNDTAVSCFCLSQYDEVVRRSRYVVSHKTPTDVWGNDTAVSCFCISQYGKVVRQSRYVVSHKTPTDVRGNDTAVSYLCLSQYDKVVRRNRYVVSHKTPTDVWGNDTVVSYLCLSQYGEIGMLYPTRRQQTSGGMILWCLASAFRSTTKSVCCSPQDANRRQGECYSGVLLLNFAVRQSRYVVSHKTPTDVRGNDTAVSYLCLSQYDKVVRQSRYVVAHKTPTDVRGNDTVVSCLCLSQYDKVGMLYPTRRQQTSGGMILRCLASAFRSTAKSVCCIPQDANRLRQSRYVVSHKTPTDVRGNDTAVSCFCLSQYGKVVRQSRYVVSHKTPTDVRGNDTAVSCFCLSQYGKVGMLYPTRRQQTSGGMLQRCLASAFRSTTKGKTSDVARNFSGEGECYWPRRSDVTGRPPRARPALTSRLEGEGGPARMRAGLGATTAQRASQITLVKAVLAKVGTFENNHSLPMPAYTSTGRTALIIPYLRASRCNLRDQCLGHTTAVFETVTRPRDQVQALNICGVRVGTYCGKRECTRNAREWETEEPRENPPTSSIAWHDSYLRKSDSDPAGYRTRFVLVRGERCNRCATAAPTAPRAPGKLQTRSPNMQLFYLKPLKCDLEIPLVAPGRASSASGSSGFHTQKKIRSHSGHPMRVIEVSMEQRRNKRVGETGDPRENPTTNGIVQHDSHMRKKFTFIIISQFHLIDA
ncbi:hypothetical protein PR048_016670 [Dryococelus australis]|uniref:Uncharacterized protein n=1 Tax=Dryococelus australis TaxID=614101 RepID=A0ABQ9H7B8_9NEOP|nr:hypothetical protein PR048_016670 [Dryococelus australis]